MNRNNVLFQFTCTVDNRKRTFKRFVREDSIFKYNRCIQVPIDLVVVVNFIFRSSSFCRQNMSCTFLSDKVYVIFCNNSPTDLNSIIVITFCCIFIGFCIIVQIETAINISKIRKVLEFNSVSVLNFTIFCKCQFVSFFVYRNRITFQNNLGCICAASRSCSLDIFIIECTNCQRLESIGHCNLIFVGKFFTICFNEEFSRNTISNQRVLTNQSACCKFRYIFTDFTVFACYFSKIKEFIFLGRITHV